MDKILRILILEDCATDIDLMAFELREAKIPFISKSVTEKEDFVRELQEFCPDIIISDYDLPQYNGSLALAEAKSHCPDTPFIIVTGAIDEIWADKFIAQGAKDFVMKSQLQNLAPAVRRALNIEYS